MTTEVRINRNAVSDNFTVLRNAVMRDESLSWKATGLLCYLLSLPSNWKLRLSHLATEKKDGRDSTRAGLAELEKAGYLHIEIIRNSGKYAETVWHVTDTPALAPVAAEAEVVLPCSENPNTVKPNTVKPTLQRTELKRTEFKKQPQQPARESAAAVPAGGGGGAFDQNLIEAAAGLGLSEQALKANAQNANDDQLQILLELYKSPPPELRNSAAWAATLARRASDGALTAATTPAPVAPTVQVWRPEEQPPATPEIKAAALERLAKLSEQMRIKPKQPPARFKQQAQG